MIKLFSFYLSFIMLLNNNSENKKNKKICYEINPNYEQYCDEEYAKYLDYSLYFCDRKYLDSYDENTNNICIVDSRDCSDPNFEICNSYRVTNDDDMLNIISILLQYEEDFPSDWKRTEEGMRIEWIIHNIAYNLGILKENSGSVNFDNGDAIIYENELLKLLFRK